MKTSWLFNFLTATLFGLVTILSGCGSINNASRNTTGVTDQSQLDGSVYYSPSGSDNVTNVVISPSPTPSGTTSSDGSAPVLDTASAGVGSYTVGLNQSVTLSASFQASPAPTYQWYKNGSLMDGETGQSLTFNSVQGSDYGYYQVVATNDYGSARSGIYYINPVVGVVQLGSRECNGAQCTADAVTAQEVCQMKFGSQSQLMNGTSWAPSYQKWTTQFCDWNGSGWSCDWNCASSCTGMNVLGWVQCYE